MRYNDSVNEKNFHRRELMYYEERDFLETADQETLDQMIEEGDIEV